MVPEANDIELTISTMAELDELRGRNDSVPVVTYLHLRGLDLGHIPDFVFRMPRLRKLAVGANGISVLPSEFARLGGTLEELSLSDNILETIPAVIGQLPLLRSLSLDNNQIETIHEDIGNCRHLRHLTIHSNKLNGLPATFGQLHILQNLYLQSNAITDLPDEMGHMHGLVELNLGSNQLEHVPPCIMDMKKLSLLTLGGNPIPRPVLLALERALPRVQIH